MKKDPKYVKDSLTEQIEREEKKKREQRKAFMDEQKRYYKEYLAKKDKNKYEKINNIISTQPIKITDNDKISKPRRTLDSVNDNLCTNITKDNAHTRAGYQEKPFVPKNQNQTNKSYNIINFERQPKLNQNEQIREQPKEEYNNFKDNYNQQIDDIYNNEFKLKKEKEEIDAQSNKKQVDQAEYQGYLEYLKQKELMEKQQALDEYVRAKKEQEDFEKQKEFYQNNYYAPQQSQVSNYHLKSKGNDGIQPQQIPPQNYIEQYKNKLQQQSKDIQTKQEIQVNPLKEAKQEYLSNKYKNTSAYTNLTHLMTLNPSLKTNKNQIYSTFDQEKLNEQMMKLEKQRLYRQYLDEQVKARPNSGLKRENGNIVQKEVPPNPYSKYNYSYGTSSLPSNPLVPGQERKK